MNYQPDNRAIRLNYNLEWLPDEDVHSKDRKKGKCKMETFVLAALTVLAIAMRIGLYIHNKKVMNGEDENYE